MIQETFVYENIFAGNVMPVVIETGTVAEKQEIQQFAIVELDANGFVVAPAGEEIDVNKAYAIAAEAVTTKAEETKKIVLYMTGEFNENKIVAPEGKTVSDYKVALRKLGIFLKPTV